GVYWFPVYNLFAFAGSLLIAFRGHIPDSISIVIGDMLFPIGYTFLNLCLTEFFGEGGGKGLFSWRTQVSLTLATLVPLIQYGLIHPDTERRLFGYSLILSIQIGLIAVFVFRRASGTLLVAGGLMAWVLAMLSLNGVVRLIGILFVGVPAN